MQAWSVMITAPLVFVEAPVGVVGLGAGALISGGADRLSAIYRGSSSVIPTHLLPPPLVLRHRAKGLW